MVWRSGSSIYRVSATKIFLDFAVQRQNFLQLTTKLFTVVGFPGELYT